MAKDRRVLNIRVSKIIACVYVSVLSSFRLMDERLDHLRESATEAQSSLAKPLVVGHVDVVAVCSFC